MEYGHKWEDESQACKICGIYYHNEIEKSICPERIVREVVHRIKAELQNANVIPAKRKDRDR